MLADQILPNEFQGFLKGALVSPGPPMRKFHSTGKENWLIVSAARRRSSKPKPFWYVANMASEADSGEIIKEVNPARCMR